MYYCFRCPPPSFVVLARYSILFHKIARPLRSVHHLLGIEEKFLSMWCCAPNRFTMLENSLFPFFIFGLLWTSLGESLKLRCEALDFLLLSRGSVY